jgi:16S rRNA (adenine1518-N6/adenine1519-N6)-dimethyltransferase
MEQEAQPKEQSLFEKLQELMLKHRFRPEKKLSQYFCINSALLKYMAQRAALKKDDVVLEVGPGTGFLTKELLNKCKVVAIEQDQNMTDLLNVEFSKEIEEGKLKVINTDALEEDYEKLGITKVVSLPPYHISSALVTKIVSSKVKKAILVLDRGFVEKLTAFEGLTEYGWLTVYANLNAKVEVLEENVEATSFFPSPNCLSVLVEMNFEEKNISQEFLIFLKEIFRHKNKDISRGLKQASPFLEKELKLKGLEKKIASMKNPEKKIYLHSPQELQKVFEKLSA